MVDANCTAKDRGHRKNSQRGRDCPATVHGGDGGNGTTAPSGTGASTTPSPAGATTTPSGTGASITPSTATGAVHGFGGGAQASGSSTAGHSVSASTSSSPTPPTAAHPVSLTDGQQLAIEELGGQLLDLALTEEGDRARKVALALMERVAAEDDGTAGQRDKLCELFNEHVLCLLFEDLAVALKGATESIPELAGQLVERSSLPPLLKLVVKLLLKQAVKVAVKGMTAPFEIWRIKACALAIALCPDTDNHHSHEGNLDENCALPLADAVTEPADVAR